MGSVRSGSWKKWPLKENELKFFQKLEVVVN
jgi:hypothetical protein